MAFPSKYAALPEHTGKRDTAKKLTTCKQVSVILLSDMSNVAAPNARSARRRHEERLSHQGRTAATQHVHGGHASNAKWAERAQLQAQQNFIHALHVHAQPMIWRVIQSNVRLRTLDWIGPMTLSLI